MVMNADLNFVGNPTRAEWSVAHTVWVVLGNHPRQHLVSIVGWKKCNLTD